MPSLFILSGPQPGRWFRIELGRLILGRGKGLPGRLRDDRVSRKHLEIRYDDERQSYIASDLASANGVFLNDRRLHDPTVLLDGTLIRIGGTVLLFSERDFDDEAAAAEFFRTSVQQAFGSQIARD